MQYEEYSNTLPRSISPIHNMTGRDHPDEISTFGDQVLFQWSGSNYVGWTVIESDDVGLDDISDHVEFNVDVLRSLIDSGRFR